MLFDKRLGIIFGSLFSGCWAILYYLWFGGQKTYANNTDRLALENIVILEVAVLKVKPGQEPAFEAAFCEAQLIIANIEGYISHQLQKCLEHSSQYILLVNWQTLEDHTEGFRTSPRYLQWRALLHHFYDPFPTVEHYRTVFASASKKTTTAV